MTRGKTTTQTATNRERHRILKAMLEARRDEIQSKLRARRETLPAEVAEVKDPEEQSVHDFVMRRRDLLSGQAGGLHALTFDEREYRRTHDSMGGAPNWQSLLGPVVLSTCARCHSNDGIFSVQTYAGMFSYPRSNNPQLLPADAPDYQRAAGVEWKKRQFDWGLLRGLLAAQP